MHLLFDYMLKMSLCLAITVLFYFLLLRRLTQYIWNRWFLLSCAGTAFVIPLVNINRFTNTGRLGGVFFINKIPDINNIIPTASVRQSSFASNIQSLFLLLFVVTAVVLLAKFILQLLSLKKVTARARLLRNEDVMLYNIDEDIAPFSFNRSIYINQNMYSPAELEEVIRHETVHVKQRHTVDVIIAELVCILNWYNPFAWLLKSAIKQNLEFIADDIVLKNNDNPKGYQYLLLKVTGSMPLAITNNLNFSSLKKRIAMMNKAKTSRLHLFRFVFVIPVACILLLAFRHAYENKPMENTHRATDTAGDTFTLGTLTYSINDAGAESLIKNEQENSFLKPGNVLSLSSIQNEKFRLANLLQQNGYNTSGNHAIYFEVDTSSANRSFSIQVTINVQRSKNAVKRESSTPLKSTLTGFEENKLNHARNVVMATINTDYNTSAIAVA